MGQVGMIPSNVECCLGQRMVLLKVDRTVCNPYYLLYALQSPAVQFQIKCNEGTGTTVSNLRIPILEHLEIPFVNKENQDRIAAFLKLIDDKIEINNKIIKNVTEQINLLFSYYSSKSGSSRVSLTEIIDVKGGGTPNTQTPEYWSGGIPFFTPKDANALFVTETDKTISKVGLENCNSRLYEKGTVFVTARGTVGKIAIAGKSMAMNQSCYALIGDGIGQELAYFYAKSAISSLKNKANGAVFDAIVTRDFKSESIIRMASSLEADFEKKAKLYFDEILTLQNQNMALNELRDSLLPRLISGEIDLKNL